MSEIAILIFASCIAACILGFALYVLSFVVLLFLTNRERKDREQTLGRQA